MRVRVGRLLGATALYLLFGLGGVGCSGQQQDEEGLEVSEQDNQAAADNQSAEDQQPTEQNEQVAENQEAANEEGAEQGEQGANEEVAEEGANGGNATENDLQEIIQEMNGQQTAEGGEAAPADATALQQEAAAPAQAAPVDTAAAVPAEAAPSSSALPFQPGGTPAAPGLPEVGSKMAYIVQSGDTLGKISSKVYGTPGRWKEMATLSGMNNPSRIYPGDVVYYTLDESAVAFATTYESIQRAEETVQAGDTLATIAQRVYGSSKAWRSIWRQNPGVDNPDVVTPGSTVYYISQGALSAALELNKSLKVSEVSKKAAAPLAVSKTFKGKFSPGQGPMLI